MNDAGLFWRTVRHLTVRQLVFQLWARLRSRPQLRFPDTTPTTYFLMVPDASKPVSWQTGTFTFLNKTYSPGREGINWNYRHNELTDYGKLWTYNLTYFDFLNQPDVSRDAGLTLILDFMAQTGSLRDGLEPYPTSLRIMNWVQFLSRNRVQHPAVNRHLFAQVALLSRRMEYHIAGNHLLENGFALLIGALYFRHKRWLKKAAPLIRAELHAQLLTDGGHNERSPMYHQLLLDRLMTVLLGLQHDSWHGDKALVRLLTDKAQQMLGWLSAITFSNGDIPMVNDSAFGIAPTTAQLQANATRVLAGRKSPLSTTTLYDSGYRLFRTPRYELFADVGPVGPDHQPGHAHADTFSFVLYVDNMPILVDKGTSTYQTGPRRESERSTAAHNTVELGGYNSSEVWAGFRVGRRAKVRLITDTQTELKARHDGYRYLGIIHERAWSIEPTQLITADRLICSRGKREAVGVARFHVHPDVRVRLVDDVVLAGAIQLSFASPTEPRLSIENYGMADGFNRLRTGQCLEVRFADSLETRILLPDTTPLGAGVF